MTWEISQEPENYIRICANGIYSLDVHRQMTEDLVSRPFWEPGMKRLYDSRGVDFSQCSLKVIQEAMRIPISLNEQIGQSKTAILLGTGFSFAIIRQYLSLLEDDVNAFSLPFTDEQMALDWLLDDS